MREENLSVTLCSLNVTEFNCEGTGILYYEDILLRFFSVAIKYFKKDFFLNFTLY